MESSGSTIIRELVGAEKPKEMGNFVVEVGGKTRNNLHLLKDSFDAGLLHWNILFLVYYFVTYFYLHVLHAKDNYSARSINKIMLYKHLSSAFTHFKIAIPESFQINVVKFRSG